MPYSFKGNPLFQINNVSDGLRAMLQGVNGGFYSANEILKVSGIHSNRTSEMLFEEKSNKVDVQNEVTDLILFRLASELNVIVNRTELVSGIIMLMTTGILLGHWKKFKLSTDFTETKFEAIYRRQLQFDKKADVVFIDENTLSAETRKFNDMHKEVNSIIESYYTETNNSVSKKFNDLFTLLFSNCDLTLEEYEILEKNTHQLLERTKNENYAIRLLKNVVARNKDIDLWSEYLQIKKDIMLTVEPLKMSLLPLFGITKDEQYNGQKKFVAHFKYGFKDDLNSIFNKLDLEVD